MGKAKARICLSCATMPRIIGNSWGWHCANKHKDLNKSQVQWKYEDADAQQEDVQSEGAQIQCGICYNSTPEKIFALSCCSQHIHQNCWEQHCKAKTIGTMSGPIRELREPLRERKKALKPCPFCRQPGPELIPYCASGEDIALLIESKTTKPTTLASHIQKQQSQTGFIQIQGIFENQSEQVVSDIGSGQLPAQLNKTHYQVPWETVRDKLNRAMDGSSLMTLPSQQVASIDRRLQSSDPALALIPFDQSHVECNKMISDLQQQLQFEKNQRQEQLSHIETQHKQQISQLMEKLNDFSVEIARLNSIISQTSASLQFQDPQKSTDGQVDQIQPSEFKPNDDLQIIDTISKPIEIEPEIIQSRQELEELAYAKYLSKQPIDTQPEIIEDIPINSSKPDPIICTGCGQEFESIAKRFVHFSRCQQFKPEININKQNKIAVKNYLKTQKTAIQTTLNNQLKFNTGPNFSINFADSGFDENLQNEYPKYKCLTCTFVFDSLVLFKQHKTQCPQAKLKTLSVPRKSIGDQTAICLKNNRQHVSNFYEAVLQNHLIPMNEFQSVSELFCDGIKLSLPAVEQFKQKNLDRLIPPFIRQISRRDIKGVVIDWQVSKLWITFPYFKSKVDQEFINDAYHLLQEFRNFSVTQAIVDRHEDQQDICITQFDTTLNFRGTFYSLNWQEDYNACMKQLTKCLNTKEFSNYFTDLKLNITKESRNSMQSCFQYWINCKLPGQKKQVDPILRFKFYAKTLDLIQKETNQKLVGSRLSVLLGADQHPDKDFYNQLQSCWDEGMSRIEISHYFQSYFPFDDLVHSENKYKQLFKCIDTSVDQIKEAINTHIYKVSTVHILRQISIVPQNICVIAPTYITMVLTDNNDKNSIRIKFTGTGRKCRILWGVNNTTIREVETFIKRHASIDSKVLVILHNNKPLGVVVKRSDVFVPPGVIRQSHYNPDVPSQYRFTITQDELNSIQLEGFEDIIKSLKKINVKSSLIVGGPQIEFSKSVLPDKILLEDPPIILNKRTFSTRIVQDDQSLKQQRTQLEIKVKDDAQHQRGREKSRDMKILAAYYDLHGNNLSWKDFKATDIPDDINQLLKVESNKKKIHQYIKDKRYNSKKDQ